MKDLKTKVLRGGLARLLAQPTMFILRFGSFVILARLLTPHDFGLVAMVSAFTGALGLFRDFGLSAATVQRPTVTPELISTMFWINMLVGSLLTILAITLSPLIASFYQEAQLRGITNGLAIGFLINAAGVQHRALLERDMRFTTLAIIDVVALVVAGTVGVSMALTGYGYWSLIGMTIAVPVASTIGAWITTGWVPGMPRKDVGAKSMIRFGGTTTLNVAVVYVAYNLEKVLLGRFWGAAATGIYGVAYQFVNVPIDNLNNAVGGLAFSALSRLQGEPERFKTYFLKGYALVISLTIPVAISFALFATDIVAIALGAKWKEAAPILRALAPTVFIFALINPLGWMLFSLGLVGRSLKVALVLAPIVITGYLAGLPYGPIGVATGYSISLLIWVLPHIYWCVHGTVISFKDIALAASKPLSAGILAGLLVAAIQATDILGSPLSRVLCWCPLLFIVHFGIIFFLMGEKDLYLNLARSLLRPRTELS